MVPAVGTPLGTAIVIDTTMACDLLVRLPLSVMLGLEQDDMTRNACTVLAEGRWSLRVAVPAAIC